MTNVEKLTRARHLRHWSQKKMAEALRINRSYLSQLENGDRPISDKIIQRLEEMEAEAVDNATLVLKDEVSTSERPMDLLELMLEALAQESGERGEPFEKEVYLDRLIGMARAKRDYATAAILTQELAKLFKEKGKK